MKRHFWGPILIGFAAWGLAPYAEALTQKVTISQASAVVDSVTTALPSLQGDTVVDRIIAAMRDAGYVQWIDVVKSSTPVVTTDINGVQTSVLDYHAFVAFPAHTRVPPLLLALKQTRVQCPAALPTGVTCTNTTTFVISGPLASYGQTMTPVALDRLLRGKQTLTWILTQATTGTGQTLQGNFSATSVQFEKSILQALQLIDSRFLQRLSEPITQNRVMLFMSSILTAVGERVMQ